MKIKEMPLAAAGVLVFALLARNRETPVVELAQKVAYAKQHENTLELYLRRSMPKRAVMRIMWHWHHAEDLPDGVAVSGSVNGDKTQTFTLRVWSNDPHYRSVYHSGGAELLTGAPLFDVFKPQVNEHGHERYGYWYK